MKENTMVVEKYLKSQL